MLVALLAVLAGSAGKAGAISANLVLSQVYGGGGNSGSTLTHDYIEIFNRGSGAVSLDGLSLQYASATGTGFLGANSGQLTELPAVSLDAGHYFLVREASNITPDPVSNVPADYTGDATPVNMSATSGKVALVTGTTSLGCNGGTTVCPADALARIVDLVGYGGANFFEGTTGPTAAPSTTNAVFRKNGGCTDTDDNAADFTVALAAPRNGATAANECGTSTTTNPSGSGAATPSTVAQGEAVTLTVAVTPGTNPTSTGITVTADLTSIGGAAAQAFLDNGTNGDVTAGDNTFTFATTVPAATTSGIKTLPFTVADAESRSGGGSILLGVTEAAGQTVAIHDIQGAAHLSPLSGQTVSGVQGIVTAKISNGYWMQDPNPDANAATSEGIFVFTSSAPTADVGDAVSVRGRVQEFRPGGASSTNLTTTELSSATTTVLSSGNPLPAATVVGTGGRISPDQVIEDDATGDVETSGVFDPGSDGIDFWETLEGMRVQLNNAVAVGPTSSFDETPVIGDDGANASVRTARGGILLRPDDGNPERVTLDNEIIPNLPSANVGDHYQGSVEGVLDYDFGLFMLEVTAMPTVVHDGVTPETTTPAGPGEISVGTFNFENLDPGDPPDKFARLAGILVHNLGAPDIVSGEEVQDDNGPTDDGTVGSDTTLNLLVAAIEAAGGPHYDYRYINPVNDQDGGEPGGNIRQVFLFRTDRGVSFVDRPGGGSTTATTVVNGADGPELSASPGRIDPTNAAFTASRKPLAGEFLVGGQRLFVIANHFNSKGGDQPLFGHFQPPVRPSETQRHQQAQIVHDFVGSILAADPNASVVVDGDLNDFEFSDTLSILKGTVLEDLIDTLPQNERYTYVFEGNSQTLDHILMTSALTSRPFVYDVVHVNSEFADQASDHEPSLVRLPVNAAPTADAGGPYTVGEGGSVQLTASGTDPENGQLTYAWDLDGNGTFETPGQTATFSAAGLDGPSSQTVAVQVTDDGGLKDTATATVEITNVAPSATFTAPGKVFAGSSFTIALTNPSDPSAADTAAGFDYALDCGDGSGFGAFSSTSSATCPTTDTGSRTVRARIRDKDGGVKEYSSAVSVVVTYASLCDLSKQLVDNKGAETVLCATLTAAKLAEAKHNSKLKATLLQAYRAEVDLLVRTHVVSAADGALLKRLSTRL
jgi:hypothetical protein